MSQYDFRVTGDFIAVYESLDDQTVAVVDGAIARLLDDHQTAWARQGRVTGPGGEAWILEIRTSLSDISLYWDYLGGRLILLILLVVR